MAESQGSAATCLELGVVFPWVAIRWFRSFFDFHQHKAGWWVHHSHGNECPDMLIAMNFKLHPLWSGDPGAKGLSEFSEGPVCWEYFYKNRGRLLSWLYGHALMFIANNLVFLSSRHGCFGIEAAERVFEFVFPIGVQRAAEFLAQSAKSAFASMVHKPNKVRFWSGKLETVDAAFIICLGARARLFSNFFYLPP